MIRRLGLLLLVMIALVIAGGCSEPLADGTLSGIVLRASDGQPVPNAVIVVGRQHKSPLMPDQMGYCEENGTFSIIVNGGNYNIQVGSKKGGPYYMWPDTIYIAPNDTTQQTFVLPDGY
jgi:hypothetical protein